jgi:hypothetical protein
LLVPVKNCFESLRLIKCRRKPQVNALDIRQVESWWGAELDINQEKKGRKRGRKERKRRERERERKKTERPKVSNSIKDSNLIKYSGFGSNAKPIKNQVCTLLVLNNNSKSFWGSSSLIYFCFCSTNI